jgi:DNA-binding response OmpR family regulator
MAVNPNMPVPVVDDYRSMIRIIRNLLKQIGFANAESKTENVIAAKKAGMNNYIVKPFNAATLKAKIDEAGCPHGRASGTAD